MSARIFIPVMLVMSVYCTAHATEVLTKEEARKQIEAHINEYLYTTFHIDQFVKKNQVHDNLTALKKEGYIDIIPSLRAGTGNYEIKVLEKGKPLFARYQHNKLYFRVADVETKIIAIKKLPADKNGSISYHVEYKEKLTRTRFLELWGVNHCFDGKEYNTYATLTRTKKGWKVEHEYFN